MINFRYHVVSLIAVFLALGVGLLFGSTLIPEATVEALKAEQARLDQINEELRSQVEELQVSVDRLSEFTGASRDLLVRQKLRNFRIAIISLEGSEVGVVGEVEETVVQSGAEVLGSLVLSERLDLSDEGRLQQAAVALNTRTGPAEELRPALLEAMVGALVGDPGFFSRLTEAGLATERAVVGGVTSGPAGLAPEGTGIVIIGAAGREFSGVEESLLAPLAQALAGAGAVVAAGEAGLDGDFLGFLRGGGAAPLVTADSVESPLGQAALVLGVEAAFRGSYGHYGVGRGATRVLPEPPPILQSPSPGPSPA